MDARDGLETDQRQKDDENFEYSDSDSSEKGGEKGEKRKKRKKYKDYSGKSLEDQVREID